MAHDGLGDSIGQCLGVFYANDGMVGSWDLDWLQHLMNVLVGLFRRYFLEANVSKSHTMTFQLGILWFGVSEEAKALKGMGVVELYWLRLRISIPCLECVFELTAGSMTDHCRRIHGMEPAIDWIWLPVSHTEHQTSSVRCEIFAVN